MDKTLHRYASLDTMKGDEYRYWQDRPVHERMSAVWEITLSVYQMKGLVQDDEPRLQRTLVRLPSPER